VIASGNRLPITQTSWNALPKKLQILTVFLAVIAVFILCWSSWEFAAHMPTNNGWIILAMMALATFPFFINLPQIETIVTFGETYFMAIALLYGPSTCVISTAIYALLFLLASKPFKPFLIVFGFSVLVCDAFLYSVVVRFIKPTAVHEISAYLLPAALTALISFLFTSLVAATAISWQHDSPISAFWVRAYPPLLLNSFVAAGSAACIAAWSHRGPYVPLAFIPAIGIMWWWTKAYNKRLMRKAALEPSL
jgi:hypothetical protein